MALIISFMTVMVKKVVKATNILRQYVGGDGCGEDEGGDSDGVFCQ